MNSLNRVDLAGGCDMVKKGMDSDVTRDYNNRYHQRRSRFYYWFVTAVWRKTAWTSGWSAAQESVYSQASERMFEICSAVDFAVHWENNTLPFVDLVISHNIDILMFWQKLVLVLGLMAEVLFELILPGSDIRQFPRPDKRGDSVTILLKRDQV